MVESSMFSKDWTPPKFQVVFNGLNRLKSEFLVWSPILWTTKKFNEPRLGRLLRQQRADWRGVYCRVPGYTALAESDPWRLVWNWGPARRFGLLLFLEKWWSSLVIKGTSSILRQDVTDTEGEWCNLGPPKNMHNVGPHKWRIKIKHTVFPNWLVHFSSWLISPLKTNFNKICPHPSYRIISTWDAWFDRLIELSLPFLPIVRFILTYHQL